MSTREDYDAYQESLRESHSLQESRRGSGGKSKTLADTLASHLKSSGKVSVQAGQSSTANIHFVDEDGNEFDIQIEQL